MNCTPEEFELALRYMTGDINDVQLNYLSYQGNISKRKIKRLANQISSISPFLTAVGLLILFVLFHFLFLLIYPLIVNFSS